MLRKYKKYIKFRQFFNTKILYIYVRDKIQKGKNHYGKHSCKKLYYGYNR